MQKFWNYISLTGTHSSYSIPVNRSIILSNRVSLVVALLILFIGLLHTFFFDFGLVSVMALISSVLFSIPWLLNSVGLTKPGRLVLCLLPPLLALFVSIILKRIFPQFVGESVYYDYRYMLLAAAAIPPMVFALNERLLLLLGISFMLLSFVFFDPIHAFFGVGFYQTNHTFRTYEFSNILAILIFGVVTCEVLVLKNIFEDFEKKNENLIEELTVQTDKLNESQEKLQEANEIIKNQKDLLQRQNRNLESELVDKNKNLTDTNAELIKHNNELRQFSYTVSHNLRGPVASLLGLVQLVNESSLDHHNNEIFLHAKLAIEKLDVTIRDLGKIIDIRNDIFKVRQRIWLNEEINHLQLILRKELEAHRVTIHCDFSKALYFYSVRPMVSSILYNLVSNAIKYRSAERRCIIDIHSDQTESEFILKVRDNGMGIDLALHKDNLFKLYKRFHYHIEGKGIGLYLIKLQAEALSGSVSIESEINKFTEFTVHLRKPENIERQVLFEESYAVIFYDAKLNSTGIIWNGPVTSQQYRTAFTKSLELAKTYSTPNYIADLTRQGPIQPEDQQWAFQEIMPESIRNGLLRIAAVRPDVADVKVAAYLREITKRFRDSGVTQLFFHNMDEASYWIEQENEKASLTNS